ncbi:MAG: DUF4126 domain-containing protein [Lapillicoccus sp.]
MFAVLTGMGLSAAAGLNAYIPFLIVALIARFTDLVTLPAASVWMESWWAIGAGVVLLVTEVVLDKIPGVDSVNDAVQTVIRPAMGGVVFSATSAASQLDSSTWLQEHAWVGVVLGILLSGIVHSGKAVARPAINAGTVGFGAPVVSSIEDTASVGLSLVALFIPLLVIVALAVIAVALWRIWSSMRRWRRQRAAPAVT